MRSKGAFALSKSGNTQPEIAREVSEITGKTVSQAAVCQWLSGATKPSPSNRAALHNKFGVEPMWWDEPSRRPASPSSASLSSAPPATHEPKAKIPSDVLGKVSYLEKMVHRLMSDLEADEDATFLERAKTIASVTATLGFLAKLTGEFDLASRLFRLPLWKKVEQALEEGLRGHPEAAVNVARALRDLEEQSK